MATDTRPRVQKLTGAAAVQALPLRIRQAAGYVKTVPSVGGSSGNDEATEEGLWTHVLIHEYADAILVLVTQLGKVGCLTQVTMHRRPSHYSGAGPSRLLGPDLYGDDDLAGGHTKQSTISSEGHSQSGLLGDNDAEGRNSTGFDDTAALLGSCTQQRLLGSHAPGQRALYGLYNANIASRAVRVLAGQREDLESSGHDLQDKTVVVGLALAPIVSKKAGTAGAVPSGDDEDDDDDDFVGLAEDERTRFHGILDLVSRAKHPSLSASEMTR